MIKRAIYSALIFIGIVFVVGLSSYILVPCISKYLTDESARYVFSSVSQSLAAIFALTFVVTSWITSFTAKDMAKHVFEYVFGLIPTWVTVWLFILSITLNFLYLGFTDKSIIGVHNLLHYSYGFLASVLLFIISISYLIWYAAKIYRVSVSPFEYFYESVFKGLLPSLKSLINLVDMSNSVIEMEKKGEIRRSLFTSGSIGKITVYHSGKNGFLSDLDINSLHSTHEILQNNSSEEICIEYFAKIGDEIYTGRPIFEFKSVSPDLDKIAESRLSETIEVDKIQPGYVDKFDYVDPLFEVVKEKIRNNVLLDSYIDNLIKLAGKYVRLKSETIRDVDNALRNFNLYLFLDKGRNGP